MTVDTAELRHLLAAATPGPWEALGGTLHRDSYAEVKADAALIVAAVNALSVLLDRLDTHRVALTKIARPSTELGYLHSRAECQQVARAALDTEQT